MANRKRLEKIVHDIYVDLFKHSTPSADYNQLVKEAEKKKPKCDWFLDYKLDAVLFINILNNHIKKHKLKKYEKEMIKTTIYLGHSPVFA